MASSTDRSSAISILNVPSAICSVIVGKEKRTLRDTENATGTKITVEEGTNGRAKVIICGTTKREVEMAEDSVSMQIAATMDQTESISTSSVCIYVETWSRVGRMQFEKQSDTSVALVENSIKGSYVLLKGWEQKAVRAAKKILINMAEKEPTVKPNMSRLFTTTLEVRSNVLSSKAAGRRLQEIEDDTNSSIVRMSGKNRDHTRFTVRAEEQNDVQDAVKQLTSLLAQHPVTIICCSDGDDDTIDDKQSRYKKIRTVSPDSSKASSPTEILSDSDTKSGVFPQPEPAHSKYPKAMNLLVLGETGVGKSTFINGLVNYLKYESMENALDGGVQILIKSSFTLTDENFRSREIVTEPTVDEENSSNEVFGRGQSATQDPKSYVFHWGEPGEEKCIRIIDTPGIGDTRGLDQDKENFEKILSFISNFSEIHAICILIKPNTARLTVAFRFCIDELLVHLHKSASQNILFCFTNTRGTLYKPGDTLPTLREHLERLEAERGITIPLDKSTLFSLDNESFRFLCACKSGFEFTNTERSNFAGSWTKSVEEALRLFLRASELPIHKVSDTLCLNNTRSIILALSRPLAEIARNQMINMRLIEDKMKEIEEHSIEGTNLRASLYVDQIVMNAEELPYPQTVCTAASCVSHVRFSTDANSPMQTHYKTICHEHCCVNGVQAENCPNTRLQRCSAMDRDTLTCVNCDCLWSTHMHIRYKLNQQLERVIDPTVERSIQNKDEAVKTIEIFLNNQKEKVDELKAESEKVSSHCAEFAAFLSANSIIPYNDSYRQYIEHLIKQEREKVGAGASEDMLLEMEKYKEEYEQEVRLLNDSMKQQAGKLRSVEDMDELIKELETLEHCGAVLNEIKNLEMKSVRQTQLNSYKMIPLSGAWFSSSKKRGFK